MLFGPFPDANPGHLNRFYLLDNGYDSKMRLVELSDHVVETLDYVPTLKSQTNGALDNGEDGDGVCHCLRFELLI